VARTAYLDTSIFFEMGAKKSKYKVSIRALLKELKEGKVRIYTSMITVQELAVATFRAGTAVKDTYSDINSIARVYGITKEIALTAAKHEAHLLDLSDREVQRRDRSKPETEEQKLERICANRRRKWDCFHLATAQEIGCAELYSTDEKLETRPDQLGIKSLQVLRPDAPVRTIKGPLVDAINAARTEPQKK
jgi:predicted nucleic acid-binding protein